MNSSLNRMAISILLLVLIAPSYAGEGATVASLLAPADEGGWNLEAMIAGRGTKQDSEGKSGERKADDVVLQPLAERSGHHAWAAQVKSLRRQVQSLKAALDKARREISAKKNAGTRPGGGNEPAEKQAVLERSFHDLAAFRAALSQKSEQLTSAERQVNESRNTLTRLQENMQQKDKAIRELTSALKMRSGELKKATAALVNKHGKRQYIVPSTPEQQEAYVAGLMMADEINSRLEGWTKAGVKTDATLFHSGLEDGLAHTLRLKASEAGRAQATFMRAVQNGVIRKVADAQKQLVILANGRHALKSGHGIDWYRVRSGKTTLPGRAVKLSLIERVAGGREVSHVPALTLRPVDNVPTVVRDGMYLPGEGGEVVAYALARDVYGEMPLPAGVQPWTVMEYHLKGLPLAISRG